MRKVFVTEFISLDGVIEAPYEWHFPYFGDDAGMYKDREVRETGALLLGRTTYETFASAWPERGEDMAGKPEPTDPDSETIFEDRFNWMPKYVVSDTMTEADAAWHNSHILRGDGLVDAVKALKAEDGKHIAIQGSGKLIESLLPTGVIDEYRLMVHPVVVGKGQRLFPEGTARLGLQLVSVEQLSRGVLLLTYAPGEPEDA